MNGNELGLGQTVGQFIDVGDRVRIAGNANAYGSDDLTDRMGERGVVTDNDGFGLCTVEMELDGSVVLAWNRADLERA